MTFGDSLKDSIEIEWTDDLVDAICDKAIQLIEEGKADLSWTLERLNQYHEHLGMPKKPKSHVFYAGYNAGLEDAKIILGMIKDRQDLTKAT